MCDRLPVFRDCVSVVCGDAFSRTMNSQTDSSAPANLPAAKRQKLSPSDDSVATLSVSKPLPPLPPTDHLIPLTVEMEDAAEPRTFSV